MERSRSPLERTFSSRSRHPRTPFSSAVFVTSTRDALVYRKDEHNKKRIRTEERKKNKSNLRDNEEARTHQPLTISSSSFSSPPLLYPPLSLSLALSSFFDFFSLFLDLSVACSHEDCRLGDLPPLPLDASDEEEEEEEKSQRHRLKEKKKSTVTGTTLPVCLSVRGRGGEWRKGRQDGETEVSLKKKFFYIQTNEGGRGKDGRTPPSSSSPYLPYQ